MEEDQDFCRVCRSESTPDHPLYHPCKCSGSIRFVHEDCLIEWLSHSRKKYCELCEHPFTFSPIYRDDMPEKVPFYVLCSQLLHRLVSAIKTLFRGLTVVIVWLIILPNFTLWTWRFYFWSGENIIFNKNTTELPFSNSSTLLTANNTVSTTDTESVYLTTLKNFLADCLEGQIITAFVIIIFVAAYLFREWVMQNLPVDQPIQLNEENNNLNNNNNNWNNEQLVQEQVALDTLLNAMQVMNPPENNNDQADNFMNRIEHQLDNLRVELENELVFRNNENNRGEEPRNNTNNTNNNSNSTSTGWSSSIYDRVIPESDDQLFGGMDGIGSSATAAASTANDARSMHDEDEDEEDEEDDHSMGYGSNVHGLNNSHLNEHIEEEDYPRWSSTTRQEPSTSSSSSRRGRIIDAEDDDLLPDLIDRDQREFDNAAFQRMFDEHLARRRQLEERNDVAAVLQRQQRRQAPVAPAPAPAPAAAAAAAEEDEPFDVGDDINGVLEAIGMRGNPWMLVQNSVLMSLMISLCLGIAVWIPYVIGRLVILIRPITFIETPIYLMRLITDPLVDFVLDLCIPYIWSLIGNSVKSVLPQNIQVAFKSAQEYFTHGLDTILSLSNETIVSTSSNGSSKAAAVTEQVVNHIPQANDDSLMMNMDWALIQEKVEVYSSMALARWHRFATGQTGLDRSMCILVGYLVLICLGSWYLTHGRRRSNDRASTGDTIQDIIRQQGIFLKVLFFILIELVVFPTVCGFLLDMATLPLFVNASFTSRYAFHVKSPYSSYFLHWFLGTGVLFYFAIFITVCREIIRPGVMWFIRDPNDPQFHPVQEMVERPLPNLLHKISQSALIYSVMLVFGVGTVTYSLAFTGVVFPLRLPFNRPLSTLAIDLLIIQFLLPPLIALIKPRDYSKKALDLWWHFACRQLRLTSFMFNERKTDEEGHHVRRTLKSMLLFEKAAIPADDDEFSQVGIVDDDQSSSVVFKRDGMMVRVPKYDSVPVDPKRRMLVPVDPVTLEAIDEEERRRGHPATADTNDEAQSTIVVYIPPHFKQRIIIFLFSMWFSISLFTCSVTVVPLLAGRALFKVYFAPEAKVNDLYSFALGIYIMAGLGTVIHWCIECYSTYKANGYNQDEIMTYMKEKTGKILKFLYFASTFGIVIPLLLGIAVDLFVFMPIRSFDAETGLVISISQNWSFGVAYMSIIHNVIHVLPANNGLRQKLNGLIGDGVMQADIWSITRTVIVPVILAAVLAITIPGITSWGILQMLDPKDPSLQITVTRYTYPIIFCFFLVLLTGFIFKKLIHIWMQTVRDDTYLIGKKLHNLKNQSDNNNADSSSSNNSSSGSSKTALNETTSTAIENDVAF